MKGRFQMQGGKNWIFPKEVNANRFFWDSHWQEIWSNHFHPSMGPNGGSVAMDTGKTQPTARHTEHIPGRQNPGTYLGSITYTVLRFLFVT
jgi:hypothetical protein